MNAMQGEDETVGGRSADEPFPFQARLFVTLMLLSAALRAWLLVVSRHYLNSDEAVSAMMALDILDGGPIPLFLYGQPYGGAYAVIALMAVPGFAALAPSA